MCVCVDQVHDLTPAVLLQAGELRAYGAGLLSSVGELQYCVSSEPQFLPFDPSVAAEHPFPITEYQVVHIFSREFSVLTPHAAGVLCCGELRKC